MSVLRAGLGIFCLISIYVVIKSSSRHEEPMCTSRFDYEEKLLHKLVRLEHAMELLEKKVSQQLSAIKTENSEMKEELSAFKLDLQEKQTEALDAMKAARVDLDAGKARMSGEIREMAEENEAKLNRLSGDIVDALNKSGSEKYAFSVQHANADLVNGVPTFQKIHVNQGNAYDVNTGKFTAKMDGIYVFTFNIRAVSSNQVSCYIQKNGSNVNYANAYGNYDGTSVTVYLDLKSGDIVNLGSCYNWGSSSIHFSHISFMGFKL